jgi:hypothetical protein
MLVVIAIGVGVVAAVQAPRVFGPSWGRFAVAFSGRVDLIHFGPIASASYGESLRYTTTFYYANQHFNGWVAYAPASGVMLPTDLRAVVVAEVTRHARGSELATRQIAHPTGGFLSGTRPEKDRTVVNGLTVLALGPHCGYGQCQAEIVVSDGRVVWDVLAASNGPASTVEDFIDSFQPIG